MVLFDPPPPPDLPARFLRFCRLKKKGGFSNYCARVRGGGGCRFLREKRGVAGALVRMYVDWAILDDYG